MKVHERVRNIFCELKNEIGSGKNEISDKALKMYALSCNLPLALTFLLEKS